MLAPLLVCLALWVGQAEAPTAIPPAEQPPAPAPTPPPDRWLLMRSLQGTWPGWLLDGNRLQISGWTDMSFTASSDRTSNLPMGFNHRANDFLLQQNWLRIERPVVTSGATEPTFGFRSDTILPGSDYLFTLPRGIFNSQLTADHGKPELYGIDPIQFYLEAYFPTVGRGLDVKFGRFFAQYGVEANDAISNALLSHAYTFIYDPFTHTGLLTTLKLTDLWSLQAGMVLGSDIFIDPADTPTFIGSVKWAGSDQRDSVLFSVILGSGRFNEERNFHNPEIFDLVYTHKFNPRWNYSFESLFGFTHNVPDIGRADWFGVLNYLTYDFTPRWSGTTRLEFFDDAQGQRTGFKGLYTTITAGLSFKPRKSIILRPEVRYDYNEESRPFENHHGLFTAATDLLLRW
jgi:Putative beta-barrel porin-2, OmpL-like. bbp2